MSQLTRKEIIGNRARAIYNQYPKFEDDGKIVSYEEARKRSLSNGNLAYCCAIATIEADEKAGVLMLVEEGEAKAGDALIYYTRRDEDKKIYANIAFASPENVLEPVLKIIQRNSIPAYHCKSETQGAE